MSFPLVQTQDRNVNQLQQNIAQAVNPLLDSPYLQGSLLTAKALTVGTNNIPHGLGRQLQGWSIARMLSPFSEIVELSSTDTTLVLSSSAATTVNLYVY